ncbi:uncharacterized protein LOC107625922 isoform X2 [Arachis ipaensis]|uniref:uncharacterized protein LOC107625922 isoform X2 n=1 Tax=Arachis ipaensis TaxID=130454 RepID=UPI000A2B05EB|nr:uncharacterized protein LOC107625922 isoform X2 [Arachis ipaensis]
MPLLKTFRDKDDKVDELLTSPTPMVAGSFGCLRRTVLDERLKCNEYSTTALTGTLLHQIFQVGLTEDNPSIDFLEGYTEVVLLRNIESLYACGVNESDVRKTLIDAVPRILSWILRFTNKEENEDPNVCFGFHNRPNKVTISEASSNLTDSFYPLDMHCKRTTNGTCHSYCTMCKNLLFGS